MLLTLTTFSETLLPVVQKISLSHLSAIPALSFPLPQAAPREPQGLASPIQTHTFKPSQLSPSSASYLSLFLSALQ